MGLTVVDFDLVEANEAFAAKFLAVVQELGFTYFPAQAIYCLTESEILAILILTKRN